MTKMRVHELARELGMDNKELVDILQKKNVEIKNHMSTIEDNIAEEIRSEVSSKGEKKTSGEEEKAAGNPDAAAEGREATAGSRLVFKVQVMAVTAPLPPDDKRLKGMRNVDCYQEGGWYKYTCGVSADYNEMVRLRRKLASKFKGAFIVAFKNGKKMDINEAIEEFLKSRDKQ